LEQRDVGRDHRQSCSGSLTVATPTDGIFGSDRRHLVENFFCAIKTFRRIATRYEKTDTCFAAMINVVAVVLWTQ